MRSDALFTVTLLDVVTTYSPDTHPWRRVVETFVRTPDGVRVYQCAIPRDPSKRPTFRGITVTE